MKIEFNTDSAAFKEPYTGNDNEYTFLAEYAFVISNINNQVAAGMTSGTILDSNGNKIGKWSL